MLNNTNKMQLDRLAEYIGTLFGVVNDSGMIEYCNSDKIDRVSKIVLGMKGELYSSSFFICDGILFHNIAFEEKESLFIFLELNDSIDEVQGRRLLGLASLAIECREQQNIKNLISMFKKLLTEGRESVSEKQIKEVYSEYLNKASSYMVILVSKYRDDIRYEIDDNEICNVLMSVFPDEQGFVVVPIDNSYSAVVCPINEENTYDDILQYAFTMHDTMISEALTDVYVSAGSLVDNIMDIGKSYNEAKTAIKIGLTFGIDQKCFVYSKMGLEKLIYSIPKEAARTYINELFGEGFMMDKSAKELLNTVHVFLMNNLNVSEASRALYIHRNTLMYRLDKFNKMTNLDCTKFAVGMKIDIALRVLQYLEN